VDQNASRSNLDLRIEKYFRLGEQMGLALFLDVQNVFGGRGYQINEDPGGFLYNDSNICKIFKLRLAQWHLWTKNI
jgi:hypothetical protein